MEPEKIRVLLATPPDKMERTARKLELKLPVARDIRMQAMNLVLGKCVLCGKFTLAGMCASCKKSAPQRRRIPWPSIKLLKMMKPSDQLLRQVCNKCSRPFMLSAGYLLRKLLSKQSEDTKNTCNGCIEREKEAVRQAEMKKLEEERKQKLEQRRKTIEERRKKQADIVRRRQASQDFANKRGAKLVYQPFAGNRGLERLKDELRKTPSGRRPQKGPKRA